MKLREATHLLHYELKKHGLKELGWKGEFDEARRRFGACRMHDKVISLSRPLVELNSRAEVKDTVLHEIAHALAWEEHHESCHHDERWKAICLRIGAKPEPCYNEEVVQPEAPWVLTHQETGEIFASYERKPKRDFSQVWIRGRKEETYGKLEVRANQAVISHQGIEKFDPQSLSLIREKTLEAAKKIASDHGVEAEVVKGSYNSYEYTLTLQFSIPTPDGVDIQRVEFGALSGMYGLSELDYQRPFRFQGKTYLLIGFKPRNRKYPVIGMDAQGGRYKFELDVLDTLES